MLKLNAYALKNNLFIERGEEIIKIGHFKRSKESLQVARSITHFETLINYLALAVNKTLTNDKRSEINNFLNKIQNDL